MADPQHSDSEQARQPDALPEKGRHGKQADPGASQGAAEAATMHPPDEEHSPGWIDPQDGSGQLDEDESTGSPALETRPAGAPPAKGEDAGTPPRTTPETASEAGKSGGAGR